MKIIIRTVRPKTRWARHQELAALSEAGTSSIASKACVPRAVLTSPRTVEVMPSATASGLSSRALLCCKMRIMECNNFVFSFTNTNSKRRRLERTESTIAGRGKAYFVHIYNVNVYCFYFKSMVLCTMFTNFYWAKMKNIQDKIFRLSINQ